MKNEIDVSVVVSTWRRASILNLVLDSIISQDWEGSFEVIVVDSESGDGTSELVNKFSEDYGYIKLIQSPVNSLCAKRNFGLMEARGSYVAFLDDDCIPEVSWLSKFVENYKNYKDEKVVLCGGVYFDELMVEKSNYYRYRDGRHFSGKKSINKFSAKELNFNNIVAMNLFLTRKVILEDGLVFDERYKGYGLEDVDYGYRLLGKGYKLISCDADIKHLELNGDINSFRKKFFHTARDGMKVFREIHGEVGDLGITGLLERSNNNKLRLLHFFLDSKLPKWISSYCNLTDSVRFLYSERLFQISLAGAYREGMKVRGEKNMTDDALSKDGWYK